MYFSEVVAQKSPKQRLGSVEELHCALLCKHTGWVLTDDEARNRHPSTGTPTAFDAYVFQKTFRNAAAPFWSERAELAHTL